MASINLLTPLPGFANDDPQSISVSRYGIVQLGPTTEQRDILQAVVEVIFPNDIDTVGQALKHLLDSHGYQLDEGEEGADEQYVLLMLPLPESHRHLGPMTLIDAVETLAGESYAVEINPVQRTVAFPLLGAYRSYLSDSMISAAKEKWSSEQSSNGVSIQVDTLDKIYGPVKLGESLSAIASQFEWPNLSFDQVLVLLFETNPHAFANKNMNHLLVDTLLSIPSPDSVVTNTQQAASQVVDQHFERWVSKSITP